MVHIFTDLQDNFRNMGKSQGGPIFNQPEHKTSYLCISYRSEHHMGKFVCMCLFSTPLLSKVVQKLQSQICGIILIAPAWLTKLWFWDLVEMSLYISRQLPPICNLLKQSLNNYYHANPTSLNHTWYLGVQLSKNTGSLQE